MSLKSVPYPRRIDIAGTDDPNRFEVKVNGEHYATAVRVGSGTAHFWVHTADKQRPRYNDPVAGSDLRPAVEKLWRRDLASRS